MKIDELPASMRQLRGFSRLIVDEVAAASPGFPHWYVFDTEAEAMRFAARVKQAGRKRGIKLSAKVCIDKRSLTVTREAA